MSKKAMTKVQGLNTVYQTPLMKDQANEASCREAGQEEGHEQAGLTLDGVTSAAITGVITKDRIALAVITGSSTSTIAFFGIAVS